MFEGDRFWFLLVDGDPRNVVRRDGAITYHRWSDELTAWVSDNGLIAEVEGPDARRSEARPVSRDEALRWLTDNTSFTTEVGERAASLDAELSARARADGDDARRKVDPRFAAAALADICRADPAVRRRVEGLLARLAEVDAGRGRNPWFSDDRADVEWAVRTFVHEQLDVGDDPTTSLHTERILRDALALIDDA